MSSTFDDLEDERNELVTRVFPRLRLAFGRRGFSFNEVDLRWGIAPADVDKGLLLPLCFAEIERCRPYFIAILGTRYGSPTTHLTPAVIQANPWVTGFVDRSVTELEIRAAVLNASKPAHFPRFYVKLHGGAIDEQDSRLTALIQEIRTRGFPVEHYTTPEELGGLVEGFFKGHLQEKCVSVSEDSQDHKEEEAQEAYQQYVFNKTVHIPKRSESIGRLVAKARRQRRPVAIAGPAGAGKTGAVVQWEHERRWSPRWSLFGRRAAHCDIVFFHSTRASADSARAEVMYRRLTMALGGTSSETSAEPCSQYAESQVQAIVAKGCRAKRILLILDGIDMVVSPRGDASLGWLPDPLPRNLTVLTTVRDGHVLESMSKQGWPIWHIPPLSVEERVSMAKRRLSDHGKRLEDALLKQLVESKQAASPQTLMTVLGEMTTVSDYLDVGRKLSWYLESEGIEGLLDRVLQRLESECDAVRPGALGDCLSALACARHGLRDRDCVELLGSTGNPFPAGRWATLRSILDEFLLAEGDIIRLSHDGLRAATRRRFLADAQVYRRAHARLAKHFVNHPIEHLSLDETPWHYIEAEDVVALKAYLDDPERFWKLWRRSPADVVRSAAFLVGEPCRTLAAELPAIFRSAQGDTEREWVLTLVLWHIGANKDAAELARKSLENSCEDSLRIVPLLGAAAGLMCEVSGDVLGAISLLRRQEKVLRAEGDPVSLGRCLGRLMLLLAHAGDSRAAHKLYVEQEALHRGVDDTSALTQAYLDRAHYHVQVEEPKKADRAFARAEQMARRLGDLALLQKALQGRAAVLFKTGKRRLALETTIEGETICRRIGSTGDLAAVLFQKAEIQLDMLDFDGSVESLAELDAVCKAGRLIDRQIQGYCLHARLYMELGALEKAQTAQSKALEVATRNGVVENHKELLTALSRGRR